MGASANFDLGRSIEPPRTLAAPLLAPALALEAARLSALLLLAAREVGTVVPEEVLFLPSLEAGGSLLSDPVRFLQV